MDNYNNRKTRKSYFIARIRELFEFDPLGEIWVSLGDVLNYIVDREDFHNFEFGYMLLWLRELCVAEGLQREDRVIGSGRVATDTHEGYCGIFRK